MDKLDSFYIYNEEGKGLRQAKGYFIYYDRNREMQEYMLENSMIRPREDAAPHSERRHLYALHVLHQSLVGCLHRHKF